MQDIFFIILTTVFCVYVLYSYYKTKNRLAKKMDTYVNSIQNTKASLSLREELAQKILYYISEYFPVNALLKPAEYEKLENLLLQAGYRNPSNVAILMIIKIISICVVTPFVYFYTSDNPNNMLYTLMGFATGMLLPEYIVKNKREKRINAISSRLPDAIDLMVICAEAGLNIEKILKRIELEFKDFCPSLAEEFSATEMDIRLTQNRTNAFTKLAKRVPLKELEVLALNLIQAEKMGTSLGGALRIIAAESRQNQMIKLEEKIGKIPAKMGVPLILFILLPLIVLLGGPSMVFLVRQLGNMG